MVYLCSNTCKSLPEEQPQTELSLIRIIRSMLMRKVEDITKKTIGLLRMNVP